MGYVAKKRPKRVIFPNDMIIGAKEKRMYQYGTPIKKEAEKLTAHYNIYDTIMPYKDFLEKPKEEKQKILREYLKRHTRQDIAKAWNMSLATLNQRIWYYGATQSGGRLKKKMPVSAIQSQVEEADIKKEVVEDIEKTQNRSPVDNPALKSIKPSTGISVNLFGEYNAEKLLSYLASIEAMVTDGAQYEITLWMRELPDDSKEY